MDDAAAMNNALTTRAVPAKTLSPPTTVSPQLQRSISNLVRARGSHGAACLRRSDDWRAFVATADAGAAGPDAPLPEKLFPHTAKKTETAGVTVREITPASLDPAKAGRLLINLHGGGYVLNGGEASTGEAVLGAHYSGMKVISVDYRMAPDHPFPAAVDDAVAVWRAVIADHNPASVGVFGTSAGGGLTLALVMKLKALGLPLPRALVASTPWTDLTGARRLLRCQRRSGRHLLQLRNGRQGRWPSGLRRCGGVDRPAGLRRIFGDFAGFPPTILTTGTRDILLSDTVRAYRALRAAGAEARLEVHEAMSHAEYIYAFDSPESAIAFGDVAAFFDRHLAG